jgi:hypothetical protein
MLLQRPDKTDLKPEIMPAADRRFEMIHKSLFALPATLMGTAAPLLLLASMCTSAPVQSPASGDAIAAAVHDAEADLAKVKGENDE